MRCASCSLTYKTVQPSNNQSRCPCTVKPCLPDKHCSQTRSVAFLMVGPSWGLWLQSGEFFVTYMALGQEAIAIVLSFELLAELHLQTAYEIWEWCHTYILGMMPCNVLFFIFAWHFRLACTGILFFGGGASTWLHCCTRHVSLKSLDTVSRLVPWLIVLVWSTSFKVMACLCVWSCLIHDCAAQNACVSFVTLALFCLLIGFSAFYLLHCKVCVVSCEFQLCMRHLCDTAHQLECLRHSNAHGMLSCKWWVWAELLLLTVPWCHDCSAVTAWCIECVVHCHDWGV